MRKVKCGMECAESYCGTVGNMRNAESQRSDAFSTFHAWCKDEGGGRSVDQHKGIGTFCSTDFSCKQQRDKRKWFVFSTFISGFRKVTSQSCMYCAKGNFPHVQYAFYLHALDARRAVKCGMASVTWCDVTANHCRAAHSIPHFTFRIPHAAVPHFTHSPSPHNKYEWVRREWPIRNL